MSFTTLSIFIPGYFRTNYDVHNWQLIINLLKENYTDTDPITRALLIDDAFDMAKNGHLNYSILINLVNCWTQETQYLPWSALLDNLDFIYQYTSDLVIFKRVKVKHNFELQN